MKTYPLAVRLAVRFRTHIAVLGAASAALALVGASIPEAFIKAAAAALAGLAMLLFLCATFDRRFRAAINAVNAGLEAKAREIGWKAQFGFGMPVGDPLLYTLALCLFAEGAFWSAFMREKLISLLPVSAFFLVSIAVMALMARDHLDADGGNL